MSTATTTRYRCPACSRWTEPHQDRCPECGFRGEHTWLVTPSEPLTPLPGSTRFEERYQLHEEIGRGGMGVVYRAFDRELDEEIALKLLIPSIMATPGLIARFKHEVKIARKLSHPNIARLHDLVEFQGQLCLSMEYIRGEPLRQVLARGPLPASRILHYLRYLLPALDLAHGLDIVHRDLKPGNVMVDPEDVPHILDFGIAQSSGTESHQESSFVGTPGYMAPEQWSAGCKVDARADLYSLGVMLYEMVCGQRPFQHRNRLLLMEMHRTRPPRPLRELAPQVPERLESAVLRLLEKNPSRRFARALDILEHLEPRPQPAPQGDPAQGQAGSAPGADGAPRRRAGAGRVLVADADAGALAVLSKSLRDLGLVVLEAADGGDAIEKTLRDKPDLILLEAGLPVLDGLEALRFLKKDPHTASLPIVLFGGEVDGEQVAFSKDLGAASFLRKPISEDVIELLIERYFA